MSSAADEKLKDLTEPPETHRRRNIWRLDILIQTGQLGALTNVLHSSRISRSPLAKLFVARASWKMGAQNVALDLWYEIGAIYEIRNAAQDATNRGDLLVAEQAYRHLSLLEEEEFALEIANFYWHQLDDHESAASILRDALASQSDTDQKVVWKRRLGDFLRYQGRWRESQAMYEDILSGHPDDGPTWMNLGWLYFQEGRQPEARQAFQRALESGERATDVYYALSQTFQQTGELDSGLYWLERAIELNPANESWYVERGYIYRNQGCHQCEINTYQELVKRSPQYARGYYELAWALKEAGRRDEAIDAIESALQFIAAPNTAYFSRAGMIYEWAGERKKAIEAYEDALIIEPQNGVARQRLSALRQRR